MEFRDYANRCSEVTRPIVLYLGNLIREAAPALEQRIKWGAPSFELQGRIVCQLMAHKKHVNFIFTQGKLFEDPHGLLTDVGERSRMKGFMQISNLKELPGKRILMQYVKAAVAHARREQALG